MLLTCLWVELLSGIYQNNNNNSTDSIFFFSNKVLSLSFSSEKKKNWHEKVLFS